MNIDKVMNDLSYGKFKKGEFVFYLNEPAKVANLCVMEDTLKKSPSPYYVVEILSTGHFLHIPEWDLSKYSTKLTELEE